MTRRVELSCTGICVYARAYNHTMDRVRAGERMRAHAEKHLHWMIIKCCMYLRLYLQCYGSRRGAGI